jgi:hypothetical protein
VTDVGRLLQVLVDGGVEFIDLERIAELEAIAEERRRGG